MLCAEPGLAGDASEPTRARGFRIGSGLGRAPYRGRVGTTMLSRRSIGLEPASRTGRVGRPGLWEGQESFDYASRPSGAVEPQAPEPTRAADAKPFRLALRAPSCMRITSSRRRETVSSSSISMPPMSASSTSG